MSNKLQLQVLLKAVDKATRPFRAVQTASRNLAGDIRATEKTLRTLDQQAGKIDRFKKVKAQLTATGVGLRQARQEAANLEKTFSALDNPTAKQSREMDKARRNVAALEEKYRSLRQSVKSQRSELSGAGIATNRLTSEQKRLGENADAATRTLNRQRDALAKLSQQQQRLTRIKERYQAGKEMAGNIAGKSTAALGMVTGTLYAEGRFIAPGVAFDRQMSSSQAILGLDKKDTKLQVMRQQARDIGATTAFSPTDVARTQTTLARSGYDADAILKSTDITVNLSLAGEVDIAEAADIVTNMQSAFQIPLDHIGRVADVMTKGFTSSNTSLIELGEAMKYAAPIARAAGASIEDATAMLGVLADNGIKGSMAGTGVSAVFTRLQAPTGESAAALGELKVTTRDKQGNFLPIEQVLKGVAGSLKKHNLGTAQRAEYFKAIFGEEAMKSAQNLVEAAESGKLGQKKQGLLHSQGKAREVARIQTDNLVGDLKNLTSAWEDIRIELFDGQDGSLRKLTQAAIKWLTIAGEWTKKNPQLAKQLTAMAGVVTALVGGLAILGLAAWPVIAGFNLLLSGSQLLAVGLAVAGKGIAATFATLALPITLTVAALIAGALMVRKYWQPIKAFIGGAVEGFTAAMGPIAAGFAPLRPVFTLMTDKLKAIFNGFENLIAPVKATQESLASASHAGKIFGEGVATALALPMTALKQLRQGIDWVLDKLGLIDKQSDGLADKGKRSNPATAPQAFQGADLPLSGATPPTFYGNQPGATSATSYGNQLGAAPATAYGYQPGTMLHNAHPILGQIQQADKPIYATQPAPATTLNITVPYTPKSGETLTPQDVGRIAAGAAADEWDKRQRKQRARNRSSMTYEAQP
ncbi:phage tail tape measure protein [Sodalis sp. RH15]|uniref:phage tail tape measure protein n=1 Tax=Sodalis sp. RH15 TaxID=3394330 RepID=UPI0039B512E8